MSRKQNQNLPNIFRRALRAFRDEGLASLQDRIRQRLIKPPPIEEPWRERTYEEWIALYATMSDYDRTFMKARGKRLKYRPSFSILMAVENPEAPWLTPALQSLLGQAYPHWELCISADPATSVQLRQLLEELASGDQRIRLSFRKAEDQKSFAFSEALSLATGEFVAVLGANDELPEYALYALARELNSFPEADLLYSDGDNIDPAGRLSNPRFKPDWSRDYFYSYNYISDFVVYRRSVLKEIGGFPKGEADGGDYGLALRFLEHVSERNIRHLPHVLYHRRVLAGPADSTNQTAASTAESERRALRAHLERTGQTAQVQSAFANFHRVIYPLPNPAPLVSLIIATRDRVDLLRQAVTGILDQTAYSPLEIIIVDNQSADPETLSYLEQIGHDPRVSVIPYDAPFNFSAMNNVAVRHARGEVLGLINNDIKVIHPEWLSEMVSQAMRSEIGAVGAKLLYENDTIQHAGIIFVGSVAGHAHRGFSGASAGYMYRAQLTQNFSAVTGACLVMRREIFDQAGGLNETLAVSFNDVHLCLRIIESGYRVLWTPYARLYHLESVSRGLDDTPEKSARFAKEEKYMQLRWGELFLRDPFYNPNLTQTREDFSLDGMQPRIPRPWR